MHRGRTATFVTQSTVDIGGLGVTDLVVTTTAAKIQIWGAFPPGIYNKSDGTMVAQVRQRHNLFAFRLN
jgi:hypothetical protein